MKSLLSLLQTYETWIYVILGITAILPLQRLIGAFSEFRKSTFGLEKETALRRIAASATMLSLVFLIILAQFIAVTFIAPLEPVVAVEQQSKPFNLLGSFLKTPTPTENPLGAPAEDLAKALASDGCKEKVLEWTYPTAGQTISGLVELKGTVKFANLGFYKYEYRQAGIEAWTAIAAGDKQKEDEPLGGDWSTRQLVNGDYELRIVATDTDNEPFPACSIPITIANTN